jgi:hypothetical protein
MITDKSQESPFIIEGVLPETPKRPPNYNKVIK